ncbi:MAG: Mbeg1-like protein [Pleomorphochaeta sp.]
MDTIYDYLYWRGDLSFKQAKINEIDLGLFATLSYLDFLPELELKKDFESYLLGDLLNLMIEKGLLTPDNNCPFFKKQCFEILPIIASKKRFSDIKVFAFSCNFEKDNDLQFAAISFELPTGEVVVSFRGTDSTLLGWKEDFMMSFKKSVAAQEYSLEYLLNILEICNNDLIIVGHSKGGNLALYSALKAPQIYHDRILSVYSFDGPGFNEKTLSDIEHSDIKTKMKTLVPQGSVIGILMQHEEPIEIVYSNKGNGATQHMIFSWEVEIDRFKKMDQRNATSLMFDKSVRNWLEKLDEEDIEKFIESIFDTTDSIGIEHVTDLKIRPLKTIYTLLNTYAINNVENRKLMEKIIGSLMSSMKEVTSEEYKNKKDSLLAQIKRPRKK